MEKAPLLSAVAVPKEEEPLNRVTVESASAEPEIVGVESLVREEDVDKEVGASGDFVSTDEPIRPGSLTFPNVLSESYLPLSRT